ncbi:MAG: DoxX family protein [Ectothiorhodospiraceae bacterium]|nr:DoxX family protein [Ectothiorhodospiraceae bacterium]
MQNQNISSTSSQSQPAQQIENGALLMRLTLGVVFLAHSLYLKMVVFTLPGTVQFFASIGLPPSMAYIVFGMEVVGGVALILGVYTRYVALALIPIALGAFWVHMGNGWEFSNEGGGWEYPLFLAVALVVQFFIGDGRYALRRSPSLFGERAPELQAQ